MRKLTMTTKMMSGAAAMFVLAGLQGYFGIRSGNRFNDRFHVVVDGTAQKFSMAAKISTAISEMVSAQRGTVIAAFGKDLTELGNYDREFQQQSGTVQKSLDEIRPLLVLDEGKALVAGIAAGLSQWRPYHEELAQQARAGHPAEADRIRKDLTAPIYRKISAASARLQGIQTEILAENKRAVDNETSSGRQAALGLLGFCLLVAAIGIVIVRGVAAEIRQAVLLLGEGAEQVASAAVQVASASQSMAQGASEQAASLEETSSSSAEISSMTRKNAGNSKVAAEFTGQVDQRVTAANQSLDQMVASMTEINTSSDKVSKIIKVIDEIAFQTNILALNAAVEAARAGEAGMGFAVVADEVRNLAQRCAQAAKDTAALIEESLTKSRDGMAKLDQVAEATRSITESSAKVKTLVDEVQLGSEEQARGIEQIAKAITQMEQVTQKNAANAEESASASEELSAQAETMRAVVGELQVMVDGAQPDSRRGGLDPGRVPSKAGIAPTHASPKSGGSGGSLAALKSAVSQRTARPVAVSATLAATRQDRAALPLDDDDFKEF